MFDFIYTLLIAPLEYWMHAALVWGYSHTEAWGPAIVVMSLAVNVVILPIYIKAEKWQEGERALRKSFEAKEAMIKRTFKGQERFAMISTMHRQAGYSPFLSLRSSLGFFLQIPFFFAAYHFLSHFEPLAGVSFLGIADLSKPDAMINLGAFSVNVLPILMTVINLASALVYTHNMTRRDKMQRSFWCCYTTRQAVWCSIGHATTSFRWERTSFTACSSACRSPQRQFLARYAAALRINQRKSSPEGAYTVCR